jgi:cytochrome c-type biogenesis protein CcmE
VILVVAIGFLAYDSASNYINPYLTVSQLVGDNTHYQGRVVQVLGTIVNGTLVRGIDGVLAFDITDGYQAVSVVYRGGAVQNLEENKEVAVQGILKTGTLEANQILVKCPSKYEEDTGATSSHSDWLFIAAIAIAVVAAGFFIYIFFIKKS